jgi:hypothetical protein
MHRPAPVPSSCLVLLSLIGATANVAGAQPAADPAQPPAPRAPRQRPGMPEAPPARIIAVADGTLTIRPPAAPNAAKPPAANPDKPADPNAPAPDPAANDLTLKTDPARTRVSHAIVMNERMTDTGQRLRTMRHEPGELADLEPDQLVHVTATDGVATEILIVPDPNAPVPAPATVVKLDAKSITVSPAPIPGAAAPPAERTYTLDPAKTQVTLVTVTAERMNARGQITRAVSYKPGTPADLQPNQLVEIRARRDLAVQIRVVPPPIAPPAARPPANPQ